MDAAPLLRAAQLVEAIEATIVELEERDDPANAEFVVELERQRDILLAELERLMPPTH